MPVYKIDLLGNPNSCLVKIGKQVFRSFVDAGAEVSLIHRRAYQNLKDKPKLKNKKSLFTVCKWSTDVSRW